MPPAKPSESPPHGTMFTRPVRAAMTPAPPVLDLTGTCGETVDALTAARASCLVVVDAEGRAAGVVTEQDVTRRVALRQGADAPVRDVMSGPPRFVRPEDPLYLAIGRMRRWRLRHLPVLDDADRPVGMLDLVGALAVAGDALIARIDALTHDDDPAGLAGLKSAQVELAERLLTDHLPAPEIIGILTQLNSDIHQRVLERAERSLREEGRGEAPVPWCLIVMGSGGRGENYLYPDQDNGLILEDYPDSRHDSVDPWFIAFAERFTEALDKVGLPSCKGYVMATNPLWRKTISQWRQQLRGWSRRRQGTALQLCDIFFDFRGAHGRLDLAQALREHVTTLCQDNFPLLSAMQHEDFAHGVALGWFNRFVTDRDDPRHRGKINLKHTGTLPLVAACRLMALRAGVSETATTARIERLAALGLLNEEERDQLAAAFNLVSHLLLRQQLRDFRAGIAVSNHVDPRALFRRERRELVQAFKAIRAFQQRVRGEFTGDPF